MKHGGDLTDAMERFGAGDPPWLDLSTGINPNPWPVSESLRGAGWERLPSRADEVALLAAARDAYRVPAEAAVVAAPGTQAVIQWLPRLAPAGSVAVLGPTYAEHAIAWSAGGRHVEIVERWDERPDAVHRVAVSPNNPDGRRLDLPALRSMALLSAKRGGWLVLDAAFGDLHPEDGAAALIRDGLPVVILRSFGKFYGLAGLRLGFAIGPGAIVGALKDALGPWAVSGPALAVGTAALADRAWADATRRRLSCDAGALDAVLAAGGLEVIGGTDLFRLARHRDAEGLHAHFASRHVWCRRFDDRPDLLRFGLPPDEAGLRLLREALVPFAHAHGTTTASFRNVAR